MGPKGQEAERKKEKDRIASVRARLDEVAKNAGKAMSTSDLQASRLAFFPRRLIEIGCSYDSKLGQSSVNSGGCDCVRVTIKEDITSKKGLDFVLAELSKPGPTHFVLQKSFALSGRVGT